MKDQGMPLGDFRFCFRYEPCSQELKARMAALDAVTGVQIRADLARAAREAEIARLEVIDRCVKEQMNAETHDRTGQSMALAAQIRKAGYTAKRSEVPILRQMARDFDDRTFELFRLGWLDKLPTACELYITRVLDQRIADLDDAEQQRGGKSRPPMLDSVREAITATAVNKRGHVDIVSLHRKDGATQIVFRASPAQSVIFPAMIDQPSLTRIRSGLIQELMLYFLPPDVADDQCGDIYIVVRDRVG